jgi:hypothetical protein
VLEVSRVSALRFRLHGLSWPQPVHKADACPTELQIS